jgi:branched-chain amino acid transport system ATP-binding protein
MLRLHNVFARYGSVEALNDISINIETGEIVCLIGANGAGKSTLLKVISGLVRCAAGSVEFEGRPLTGTRASEIVRGGVVQVPEGRKVFPDLTVLENLEMGAYTRPSKYFAPDLQFVFELFPRLAERRPQLAGLLSGGEQQMLAIGRALMAGPRLLLLDEPSMGLAPLVITEIFRVLRRLRQEHGCTILLVEQNARAALKLADRGYVLTNGRITNAGPSQALLNSGEIEAHYLGANRRAKPPPGAPAPSGQP